MRCVQGGRAGGRVAKPEGGYCLIPLRRLYAVWWCYRHGDLEFRDVRTYFALEEMLARRCIVRRGSTVHFTLPELARLTELRNNKGMHASLRRLERAGLSTWNAATIGFHEESVTRPGFADDLRRIANHRRRIPVPRRTLRWLAAASRPVLVATVLGHLFRCVYARGGCLTSEGSISATWIASIFDVDHRNVKRAKAQLRRSHWLTTKASQHWHRQRYGGTVSVNISWQDESRHIRKSGIELPPRRMQKGIDLPPPDSDKELLTEFTNQKSCRTTGAKEESKPQQPWAPSLRHVVPEDLQEPPRTAELFRQAAQRGVVKDCPMDRLQFFAAAERAKRLAKNPGGFFATILRKRLWRNIAGCDEESARLVLATLPEFFHASAQRLERTKHVVAARPRSAAEETTDPATIRELVKRSLADVALADSSGSPHADLPLPPRGRGISPAEQNGVKEGTRVLVGRRPLLRFVEPRIAAEVGGVAFTGSHRIRPVV